MIIILFWILGTLALATGAVIFGKKYGAGVLIGIYTALIVMAQIFAAKLVVFGQWVVPAAVIVYGVSFLITDALCEFYSKEEAKKAIFSGFVGSILLVIGIQIVIAWQPASFWGGQEALIVTLGFTWRIVTASLIAYLFSQNWDVFAFHWIKEKTNGKHLWLRNCVSTFSSQFLDTVLFITIAFAGTMPKEMLIGMIIGQYIVKLIIAGFDTPFLYVMRYFNK